MRDYDGSSIDPDEGKGPDRYVPCPEHGQQKVIGGCSTPGPDPYHIDKLACGHRVICMGPGDPYTIIGGK